MKKLKDISKKQWGLISTSIGSFLIIVGLLAMVGIGGTYAAAVIPDIGNEAGSSSGSSKPPSSPKPTSCTAGYYMNSSGTECLQCKPGTYCPNDGMTGPYTCPANYYCPFYGQTTPLECPSNATCGKGSTTFSCNTGYHKNSAGTRCDVSGTTCPAGQYYLDSSKNCTECEAGYYCPGGTADMSLLQDQLIKECPSGTTSSAGAKSSNECKKTCEAGQYYEGQGKCADCLAGYYCPGGTFSAGDSRAGITACPAGKYSGSKASTCKSCLPGTSSTAGSSECFACKAGTYCPAGSAPIPCPDNATCGPGVPLFTCNANYVRSGTTCVKKNSGGDSGNPGGDSGNPGGDSGNPGGDSGNPGGDSGNPGGDSGNPGGDPGNSGGGLGNTDGGNNSSNVNNNPSTATKAPLVIALMGVISLAFGVFTYWKNRKVTDM